MLAKQNPKERRFPFFPSRRWSRLPRKRGRRRCSGSPASSRPRASTALSPSAPGPPPPLSHTLFSLDFVVILFDFWGGWISVLWPSSKVRLLVRYYNLVDFWLDAARGHYPSGLHSASCWTGLSSWEGTVLVIDFDPRLNFVFFFLLWCMVGFKLLELVSRVLQFCTLIYLSCVLKLQG
jgi:hypothetical protein